MRLNISIDSSRTIFRGKDKKKSKSLWMTLYRPPEEDDIVECPRCHSKENLYIMYGDSFIRVCCEHCRYAGPDGVFNRSLNNYVDNPLAVAVEGWNQGHEGFSWRCEGILTCEEFELSL